MGHARALLSMEDADKLHAVAERIVKDGISVRETERLAKRANAGEKPPAGRNAKKRDRFYDEAELALGRTLGRKVRILVGKDERGTLEIEFFGAEDLKRLMADLDED